MNKILFLILAVFLAVGSVWAQPTQRTLLVNLQQAKTVESSKAGQIGLTDAQGNQRYAQYVEVDLVPIAYTPTATGNTQNYSEFVTTATGDVWYIDWQGRAVKVSGSGGSGCDYDWLQISDNSCPNAITDSIYKYKYVAIGARYVWPLAQLLVNDSIREAAVVIGGQRGSSLVLYNNIGGKFSTLQQAGTGASLTIDSTANFTIQYAAGGTPALPTITTPIMQMSAQDSTLRLNAFGSSRPPDTAALSNVAYFDALGKVRKRPVGDLPGGTATLKQDNYRLPATYIKQPAQGLNASNNVTNYNFASINPTYYKFSSTPMATGGTEYGGWLFSGTSGDSVAVSTPFGVVLGNSIAEGHPAIHGRLHPGGLATFDATVQDVFGTLSYTLRQLTHYRWFNHGIGSQTTAQLVARMNRDLLGQTFDNGDGRGSRTLRRKPNIAIVDGGVNDIRTGVNTAVTIANLETIARAGRDNGIQMVFLNIPGDTAGTDIIYRKIDTLNAYFASPALQELGASVVDFNSFWKNPTYNDNRHRSAYIVDYVHPSTTGYDTLAKYIFRVAKLPVLDSVTFYTELSPAGFSGYSRPTGITIQGATKTLSGAISTIPITNAFAWDSVWVKVTASANVTGTTYTGFSHIVWHYRNDTVGLSTRRYQQYNNYGGVAGSLWNRSGNIISASTPTNQLSIGTATPSTATTTVTIRSAGSTVGNEALNIKNAAGTTLMTILDNNRTVIGGSTTFGAIPLSVNGRAEFGTVSDKTVIINSRYQLFGATPQIDFQSTAVNTGGSGRTEVGLIWNAADLYFIPQASAGINNTFSWRNLASENIFRIDLANKGISVTGNALGTTITNGPGLTMQNTTASASGLAQISPLLRLATTAFLTTGSISRVVDFRFLVTGVESPLGKARLGIGSGINSVYTNDQLVLTTDGKVGIGIADPLAYLHIKAGLAAAGNGQIKLDSSAELSVKEKGVINYIGKSISTTLNDSLRVTLPGVIWGDTDAAKNVTTTETNLIVKNIRGRTFNNVGSSIHCVVAGNLADAVNVNAQLRFYLGGTLIGDTGAAAVTAISAWNAEIWMENTASNTLQTCVRIFAPGLTGQIFVTNTTLTGLSLGNPIQFKVTATASGVSGGSDDITSQWNKATFYPTERP